jgi:hypothetical protein
MYIARLNDRGTMRYIIRESVPGPTGDCFVSRDLFDLGSDPARFIHYGARGSFYLDPEVEAAVDRQRTTPAIPDPEELFRPYLKAEARREAEFYRPGYRNFTPTKLSGADIEYLERRAHLFDKRRLHYLRYASLSQARLHKAPLKLFLPLLHKSRDELEQLFIAQEAVLEPAEFRQYVYVIFDLQRFFQETAAQVMPEALDQEKLDGIFEKEFCRLFDDASFRAGLAERDLTGYLSRYPIMFFDYGFPAASFEEDYIRRFINDRRAFHFPEKKVVVDDRETAALFGVERVELERMSKADLTALYRKLAHEHHPDKGGEHDDFVRLTELYRHLREKKI